MSRARLELAEQVIDTMSEVDAETRKALTAERQRYTELVERVIQMRREGFQPPAEPTPDTPAAPSLPQKVLDAIAQVAASAAMERQLRLTAERLLRQEDGDEDKVAKLILEGEDQQVLEEFLG